MQRNTTLMSDLKSSHGPDLPASVKGKAQKIEYYHFNTPVQMSQFYCDLVLDSNFVSDGNFWPQIACLVCPDLTGVMHVLRESLFCWKSIRARVDATVYAYIIH